MAKNIHDVCHQIFQLVESRVCRNIQIQPAYPGRNLTLGYEKPNDGTSVYNKATIDNKFPIDLPGCKIRFIMKKGNYNVSGGIISQVIEAGKFSILDVQIDVSSEKREIIEITRM